MKAALATAAILVIGIILIVGAGLGFLVAHPLGVSP
jgi:hypothetical protein